jgi:hypothetical protein
MRDFDWKKDKDYYNPKDYQALMNYMTDLEKEFVKHNNEYTGGD